MKSLILIFLLTISLKTYSLDFRTIPDDSKNAEDTFLTHSINPSTYKDINSNNVLHLLGNFKKTESLSFFIKKYPELLNNPNTDGQVPCFSFIELITTELYKSIPSDCWFKHNDNLNRSAFKYDLFKNQTFLKFLLLNDNLKFLELIPAPVLHLMLNEQFIIKERTSSFEKVIFALKNNLTDEQFEQLVLNAPNEKGQTPIMKAVILNLPLHYKILIKLGANTEIKDKSNFIVYDYLSLKNELDLKYFSTLTKEQIKYIEQLRELIEINDFNEAKSFILDHANFFTTYRNIYNRESILFLATYAENKELEKFIVKELMISPHEKNRNGISPFEICEINKRVDCFK